MKTKIWALAFLIACLGMALSSAGAQGAVDSGTVSCSGNCFAAVLGTGSVDVNASGNSGTLLVRGNVSIETYGVGVCNKTKSNTIVCRGIQNVEITGKHIRAFFRGNGTLSAEGTGKVIVRKGDLKSGKGTLSYGKKGFAKITGEGNVKVDAADSTLLVRGKAGIDTHGVGKCLENKRANVTLCKGIKNADITGKNMKITVKGKGSMSNEGKGIFTLLN